MKTTCLRCKKVVKDGRDYCFECLCYIQREYELKNKPSKVVMTSDIEIGFGVRP